MAMRRRGCSGRVRGSTGGPRFLDAVHGGVIEESRVARRTPEVPEALDNETVIEPTVLDLVHHLLGPAFRTGQRFRYRCFALLR